MATITVKNIPDEIYSKIKEVAKYQHRSVNSLLIDMMATRARLVPTESTARPSIDLLAEMKRVSGLLGSLPQSLSDSLREIRDGSERD